MGEMLSEHYFGDVEAIDEGKNHPNYFHSTFILPSSLSLKALKNDGKYIVVGRKGTGKTAVQFHMARDLEENGYLTHFFSFYNELKPRDYNDAARTQKIDMLGVVNSRNIFLNYDFTEIWERTFLIKLAETFKEAGFESKFTAFTIGERGRLAGIFEGLLKSANVKISGNMGLIASEIGFDLSGLASEELDLPKFLHISKELLAAHHVQHRAFLFVDELVFSKLDAADDEVRVRAAMVRDIFRSSRNLNNYFAQQGLDLHIICSVRPEIRDLINDLDAEIGKIFDGKSVSLDWNIADDDDDSLLQRLMNLKVLHSSPHSKMVDVSSFIDASVSFGSRTLSLDQFLRTNTWSRPRDVVQLLSATADKNPNAQRIGETEIKRSLNEYGRRSFVEILEEVSVRHGPTIANALRGGVTTSEYSSYSEFERNVLSSLRDIDLSILVSDLFQYGVIGNVRKNAGKNRYYWAHRGEEYFRKDMGVAIHPGLWNYFNIR